MYPSKFATNYEKKHGVKVVYSKDPESFSFSIPLSWTRVSKNKGEYLKKGYMIIHESGGTWYRSILMESKGKIPFPSNILLVLNSLKVAQEITRGRGGIVVKICKNTL